MHNRISKAVISVILVLSVLAVSCTPAFAAKSKQVYISDLVICSASSASDAEAQLKAKGYKLLSDSNLNESLSEGIYIGYKSTANPDEAITGISSMNMNGNYSFSDYQVLLERMKEDVAGTINGLIPMINAFRDNYNADNTLAKEVYNILNKFYEDDSNQKMGDYLLKCDLADTTDITKVFMQGYSAFILDIQQLLYIAGEKDSDKTWLEKMAAADPDALLDLYYDSYATPNKAYSALIADYGQAADDIRLTWDALHENLSDIIDEYFIVNGDSYQLNEDVLSTKLDAAKQDLDIDENAENITDEEFDDALDTIVESGETCVNMIDINLVVYLSQIEYGDGTMLDFFMRSAEETEDEELYTLAYYMGSELALQLRNVGLQQTLNRILIDGDNAEDTQFESIRAILNDIEQISIYDGVDRTIFENGVALTGPSVAKYQSSGKNWSDDLFSRVFQPSGEFKWADYFAFYILPTVASLMMYGVMTGASVLVQMIIRSTTTEVVRSTAKKAVHKGVTNLIYNNFAADAAEKAVKGHFIGFLAYGKGLQSRCSLSFRIVSGIRCAFFVLTAVMVVVDIVMLFKTIFSDESGPADYSPIPAHIVDTVSTKYGDDYIAYNPVMNILGSAGDLNNYVGRNGWLVLYYTKDGTVGDPITSDMKIVKGSSKAPLDYENVSVFGQADAVNLTSKDFTGVDDSANGTYIYFNRSEISSAAGSAFSGGTMVIAMGLGAIIGILLGTMTGKHNGRRKKAAA